MGKLSVENLLASDGETAALMRSRFVRAREIEDGLQTPLGAIETWSSSLKSAFTILSSSCCPMFLLWGGDRPQTSTGERILFYNDAYLAILNETQPLIPFDRSMQVSWAEDWRNIQTDVEQVLTTGQALRREQKPFLAEFLTELNSTRHLYIWSYSAIWDETGQIGGVFATGCHAPESIAAATVAKRFQNVQELQPAHATLQTHLVESSLQQTKAALQESEARFQAFMSHSPTSAWIADQEGRLLYLSPTYFQMFQFPQQDVVGKQIHDLYSKEFAQQFLENNHCVFQTGQVIKTVETAPRPDGSIGSFWVYKFPIAQASKEVLLGGVAIDITEHKRTEEILRRREEELRLITNALPVLIAYVDKDHYYHFNNQTYEVWFGQPALSFTGKHVREVLGDAAYQALYPYMEQTLSGQRVSFESQIPYREGGIRYIKADYVPHINRLGEVEGYFSLVSDISEQQASLQERNQAEMVLRQSEERARLAIQVGRLGTWCYSVKLDVVELDKRMREIWGESDDAAIIPLSKVIERIHPDDREQVVVSISAALNPASSGTYENDYRIVWDDGSERWISANGQVLFDGEGASRQPTSFFGTALDITDRKQAEAALRQSEEQFRSLANAMPQIVWTTNANGELTYVSQQWSAYAGLTLEQTQDQAQYIQVIHPDDVSHLYEQWSKAIESGSPYQAEIRIQQASDKTYHWFLIRAVPVKTEGGQILAWYGTSTDIDDRKQTEEALRQSEERLRLAQQAVGAGLWDWDIVANRVTWDENYYRLYGLDTTVTPSYENWLAAILASDRPRVDQAVREGLEQQSNLNIEFRILHPSQGICWFTAIGQIFQDTNGKPRRMTGIVLNITDRKQAEVEREQLLAREQSASETLQRFIQHTPVTVAMLDREMRYLFTSHRWMQEYAPDYTNLKGLSHYEVMTDIPERWRQIHQQCLAGATERCEEDEYLRADGSVLWLHWEILPWYASSGDIGGIIIFAENITERKQAAQEREKLLEREQRARREAEQANRIKDEFLAVLSHELRSPLNPILGWAKLLQTRQFDEAGTRRALETIERNAKLQTQLIDDLLDVSRILSGKMMLNISEISLVMVIEAALETVRLSAEAKGIEIQKVIADGIKPISGDAGRLQQVMWNLLSNAIKFTPRGGTIEIQLSSVTRPASLMEEDQLNIDNHGQLTDYAQIQVRDTGKGINSEFLPYVFEYFRQEDGTTTRKFGGLGLGLAIVRYLTELHGGTVEAESPGEELGATFTVLLPIPTSKGKTILDQIGASRAEADASPLANLKILVVDDEADMRELMFTILEQTGAKTKIAASAAEALNVLALFKPDILISDIGMPEMDGYQLIRQVRSLPPKQGGQTPAVALTAYAGEIDRQQASAAGFQRHLAKPIEPEELVKAIATLMKSC